MRKKTEIIIVGGGTAGTIAAIQAARVGADVLLIEKNARLGGTISNAGIPYPAHFFAWGKPVVGGIGLELVSQCLLDEGRDPDDIFKNYSEQKHIAINAHIYSLIAEEALVNAGGKVLFHTMPAQVNKEKDAWTLSVCGKEGLFELESKVLIDCTGDANIVSLAGLEVIKPDKLQPASYSCRIGGYDPLKLDFEALTIAYQQALDNGELEITDASWDIENPSPIRFLQRFGMNANHILAGNGFDSVSRSDVEIAGRASVLRTFRWLKKQQGLSKLVLEELAPEAGIRETAMIRGKTTVSIDDYESGRIFDDAVCCCYYPIDRHLHSEKNSYHHLEQGTIPTIPRGALLPEGSENLIVAGRCLSSDQLANSALRVQASCMAMGQAVGALAALAVETDTEISAVPINTLRTMLERHQAIFP